MPKKKQIDEKALLKAIADGTPQSDVMKDFGFKTSTQLKVAYANALMGAGQVPELKGKTKAKKAISRVVSVNSRGSLIIPKVLVEDLGLLENDHFEVAKSKVGISLKSIKTPVKTKLKKGSKK